MKLTLPERIRVARVRAQLTQRQLADVVGVRSEQVSRWERGEAIPAADALGYLARACDVSADWLLGLQES